MLQSKKIDVVLDRLAGRFEAQIEDGPNCSECKAWGQFLEMERSHHQIGLYGTASGLIVLQSANRKNSAAVRQAQETLQFWWNQRQDSARQPAQWFLQTLRVAYLHIALGGIKDESAKSLRREVAQRLWNTQLPGGQWGHYWESRAEHDQTPQVLTTAVVILSLLDFSIANREARERLEKAAEWLESKVVSGIDLAPLPRIAAIAALVAISGKQVSKGVRNAANRIGRQLDPELGDLGVYFCSFRYSSNGSPRWGRDYFIVPKAILLAIAGFLPNAPTFLRLRAERILGALVHELEKNNFLYRPEPERAPASKDNAWLALLLKLAKQSRHTLGVQRRLTYSLLRERGPGIWWDRVIPIVAMTFVTVLAGFLEDINSTIARICGQLGVLIVGWICGPPIFELFRRRP